MNDIRKGALERDDEKWDWQSVLEEKERLRQLADAAFVEDFWKFKMVGR